MVPQNAWDHAVRDQMLTPALSAARHAIPACGNIQTWVTDERIPAAVRVSTGAIGAARYGQGGARLTVGFECRDHVAVQDVTWIEKVIAKHADLHVNSSVLFSS